MMQSNTGERKVIGNYFIVSEEMFYQEVKRLLEFHLYSFVNKLHLSEKYFIILDES